MNIQKKTLAAAVGATLLAGAIQYASATCPSSNCSSNPPKKGAFVCLPCTP